MAGPAVDRIGKRGVPQVTVSAIILVEIFTYIFQSKPQGRIAIGVHAVQFIQQVIGFVHVDRGTARLFKHDGIGTRAVLGTPCVPGHGHAAGYAGIKVVSAEEYPLAGVLLLVDPHRSGPTGIIDGIQRIGIPGVPVAPPGIDIIGAVSGKVRPPGGGGAQLISVIGTSVIFMGGTGLLPGSGGGKTGVLVVNNFTGRHIQFDRQHRLSHPAPAVDGIKTDADTLEAVDGAGHHGFGGQLPAPVILVPVGKILQVLRIGSVS